MRFWFIILFLFFSFQQNSWGENILTEFLVAKPSMPDHRFKETVIVMLYHNQEKGAAGLVINKPIEKIPISETLLSHVNDTNDWSIALCGGDDYELCFTVPESNQEALKKVSEFSNVNITRIGVVSESLGLQVKGYDGPRKSYQHF